MLAYWRDDLVNEELLPPSSIPVSYEEWLHLVFKVLDVPDFETEEGFNMMIEHPKTGKHIMVCSIDFNFKTWRGS